MAELDPVARACPSLGFSGFSLTGERSPSPASSCGVQVIQHSTATKDTRPTSCRRACVQGTTANRLKPQYGGHIEPPARVLDWRWVEREVHGRQPASLQYRDRDCRLLLNRASLGLLLVLEVPANPGLDQVPFGFKVLVAWYVPHV